VYRAEPLDLCLLPDEAVLVADNKNNCVRRLSLADGSVTTLATHAFLGPRCPTLIDGGAAVVVADSGHHKVRMLQFVRPDGSVAVDGRPLGTAVTDVAIAGNGRAGFVDGAADAAAFNRPVGLAVIHDGSILVADSGNHAIRRIAARPGKPGLVVTTVLGGRGPGFADGDGDTGRLRNPTALAMDRAGTILIADTGNAALRALHPPADGNLGGKGWLLTTLAGGPEAGGFADGAAAVASRWRLPLRLAVGADDELLVSDAGNHAVRALVPGGSLGPATGLYSLDLGGALRRAPAGDPATAAAAVERAATRHKSLLSLASGDVRAAPGGRSPGLTPLDMSATVAAGGGGGSAGTAGGGSGGRPRRTIVVPSSMLVGAYATAAAAASSSSSSTTRTGGVDATMRLAAAPAPGAPAGVPTWLANTIRHVLLGQAAPSGGASDDEDAAVAASLAALARSSGAFDGEVVGGGSSDEEVSVAVYDDLERVLAAHLRYSCVVTVAGATPALVALAAAGSGVDDGGSAAATTPAAAATLTAAGLDAVLRRSNAAHSAAAALSAVNSFGRWADGAAVVEARFRRPAGLCVLPTAGHSVLVADAGNNYIRLLVSQRALDTRPALLRDVLTPEVVARGRDAATAVRLAAAARASSAAGGSGSGSGSGSAAQSAATTTRVTARTASPRAADTKRAAAVATLTRDAMVRGTSPIRSPTLHGGFGAHNSATLMGAAVPFGYDPAAATHAAALSALPPPSTVRELSYSVAFGATLPPPAHVLRAAAAVSSAATPGGGTTILTADMMHDPMTTLRARSPTHSATISTRRGPDYTVRVPSRACDSGGGRAAAIPPPFSPSKSLGIGETRRVGDGDPCRPASRGRASGGAATAPAMQWPLGRPSPPASARSGGSRGGGGGGGGGSTRRSVGAATRSLLAAGIDPADAGTLAAAALLAGEADDNNSGGGGGGGGGRRATSASAARRPARPSSASAVSRVSAVSRASAASRMAPDTAFSAAASLLATAGSDTERLRDRSPSGRSIGAGSRAPSRSLRSFGVGGALAAPDSTLQQGVPARVKFMEDLRLGWHGGASSYDAADSRTSLAVETAGAAGDVVKALLLSDVMGRGDAAQPPAAAARGAVAAGRAAGAPRTVTSASRSLITARYTQHTAASANALKARGRPVVRAAPAFVNVASVVSHKLEELRSRVLAPGDAADMLGVSVPLSAALPPARIAPPPLPPAARSAAAVRPEDEAMLADLRASLTPDMLADLRSALAGHAAAASGDGDHTREHLSSPHSALLQHMRAAGAASGGYRSPSSPYA